MDKVKKAQNEKIGCGIGDATGLSWSINYLRNFKDIEFIISEEEKIVLKELAKKVKELAEKPCQQQKRQRWTDHHSLKQTEPLIFCDPEGAWYEIITADSIECKNSLARIWEFRLKKELFWGNEIKDDRVILPLFTVHYFYERSPRGLKEKRIGGKDGGAWRWESPLKDGYEGLNLLQFSRIEVDMQKTQALKSIAEEIFGGILEVKLEGVWWWSLGMTSDLIFLRGFENMLMDFYDYPDEVHNLMSFLRDENLNMLDYLEKNCLLSLNNGGDFHGTGGYGWTDELPGERFDPKHVSTMDMWGFCESQETVGVSPDIFSEFVFPYQQQILQRFGLNIYGCCEPLDKRWSTIKKIDRLRKVTVSPWSDDEVMAENLGKDYVYCKKVNPSLIAQAVINEDAIRKELRRMFDSAHKHDSRVEVLMRDVMTLGGNARNAVRWVEIAREEAER